MATIRRKLSTFQRGLIQVSMTSSSWDFLHKIIFLGQYHISDFFLLETLSSLYFLRKIQVHYYVTNEMMIFNWYYVITCRLYICYIKNLIFLPIFCCFYMNINGLGENPDFSKFLKSGLETQKLFTLVNFLKIWGLSSKIWG